MLSIFLLVLDLETAKALSMQEQQPVSPASPNGSYEEIGDRDSVDSLTPLHSVSSWLNIPSESEATNWVDHSYPTRSKHAAFLILFNDILYVCVCYAFLSLSPSLSLSPFSLLPPPSLHPHIRCFSATTLMAHMES